MKKALMIVNTRKLINFDLFASLIQSTWNNGKECKIQLIFFGSMIGLF
jgi:hypothetical protein